MVNYRSNFNEYLKYYDYDLWEHVRMNSLENIKYYS